MKELCPTEALHEECGVFGIYDSTGKTNMVSAVYSALYALQHRGQESCGNRPIPTPRAPICWCTPRAAATP